MKKYFSLIAVAMVAVSSVFTSCSKDDAGSSYNPDLNANKTETRTQDAEAVEKEVTYLVWLGDQQADYVDQTFELDINGTTKTLQLSDLTEVKDYAKYASESASDIERAYNTVHSEDSVKSVFTDHVKLYSYNCGKMKSGSLKMTMHFAIKANHPTDVLDTYIEPMFAFDGNITPKAKSVGAILIGTGSVDGHVTDDMLQTTFINALEAQHYAVSSLSF